MLRKHFYLPEDQLAWLENTSKQTKVSQSEILRAIIAEHIAELKVESTTSLSSKQNNG